MYYAEHRPNNDYVCSFGSTESPTLFEFETEHERNKWVEGINRHLVKDEWFSVTAKDASIWYDLTDFDDLDRSVEFLPSIARTCAGKIVRFIYPIEYRAER